MFSLSFLVQRRNVRCSSTGWQSTEPPVPSPSLCSLSQSRPRPSSCWTRSVNFKCRFVIAIAGGSRWSSQRDLFVLFSLTDHFNNWEFIKFLPVRGQSSSAEGAQWGEAHRSGAPPRTWGGGAQSGLGLEQWWRIRWEDLPQNKGWGLFTKHVAKIHLNQKC